MYGAGPQKALPDTLTVLRNGGNTGTKPYKWLSCTSRDLQTTPPITPGDSMMRDQSAVDTHIKNA